MSPFRKRIRVALFAILGVLVVALIYDQQYARPKSKEAYDKIMSMNRVNNTSTERHILTNKDVQKALGRKPSRVETVDYFQVEVYSWRGGLPFRTYDLFFAYLSDPSDERLFLHRQFRYKLDYDELIPPPEHMAARMGSVDSFAEADSMDMGAGPPPPGDVPSLTPDGLLEPGGFGSSPDREKKGKRRKGKSKRPQAESDQPDSPPLSEKKEAEDKKEEPEKPSAKKPETDDSEEGAEPDSPAENKKELPEKKNPDN